MLLRLLRKHSQKLALVMLLYLLLVALASLSPFYLAKLVDELSLGEQADQTVLIVSAAMTVGASLFSLGLGFFLTRFLGRMSIDITTEIRTQVLQFFLTADPGAVPDTGEFITAMTRDVGRLAAFITQDLGSILIAIASFLGVSLILVRMDWLLYCLLVAFVPIFWLLYRRFARVKHRLARWHRQSFAGLSEELAATASQQRTIYLHHGQRVATEQVLQTVRNCNQAEFGNIAFGASSGLALSSVSFVMNTAALLIGIVFVLRGRVTLGMLLAFTGNSSKLLAPVASLTGIALSWQETKIALDNLGHYSSVGLIPAVGEGAAPAAARLQAVRPFAGGLRLDGSLQLTGMVSLVGNTGSGKSSICASLAGYIRPASGQILLTDHQGQPLEQCAAAPAVFLIDANMRLFEQLSICDNLSLGYSEREAGIADALAQVELSPVLNSRGIPLEQGVQAAGFSHGEQQRLLLARGLLSGAQLLILDEALSGIDPDLCQRIIERIRHRFRGVLLVSHRRSDHQLAERIYQVDDGTIAPVSLQHWRERHERVG